MFEANPAESEPITSDPPTNTGGGSSTSEYPDDETLPIDPPENSGGGSTY